MSWILQTLLDSCPKLRLFLVQRVNTLGDVKGHSGVELSIWQFLKVPKGILLNKLTVSVGDTA